MKVSELIKKLNEYPKDAEVDIRAEGGYVCVEADILFKAKGETYRGKSLDNDILFIGDY